MEEGKEKNLNKDVAEKPANLELSINSSKEGSSDSTTKGKTNEDDHLKRKADDKEGEERSTRIKVLEKIAPIGVSTNLNGDEAAKDSTMKAGVKSTKEKEEIKEKPCGIIPPDPGKVAET